MLQFRNVALKNEVDEKWIGRVESTILSHLKDWGEYETSCSQVVEINGHLVSNVRMEQAYKGNYHLYANIDGNKRKFVIGKNKEEFAIIEKYGMANISEAQLIDMVKKYLCK